MIRFCSNYITRGQGVGHLVVKRMLMIIRQQYFWLGCKSDVERCCKQCNYCAQIKPGPGYAPIPSTNRYELINLRIPS